MRLIPAWAGKTSAVHSLFSASQAHPRVGGENLIGVAADLSAQGSSPRGRGKRFRCSDDRLDLGLIPAWAGKTSPIRCKSSKPTAHPRVGGENSMPEKLSSPPPGSSPRGRGKLTA